MGQVCSRLSTEGRCSDPDLCGSDRVLDSTGFYSLECDTGSKRLGDIIVRWQLGGVGLVMEEDVPSDSGKVRLPTTVEALLEPACVTDSIKQFVVS